MKEILPYLQIITAILLITVILLQKGGAAMGSAFGQDDSFHTERRGSEKILFFSTVALGAFFVALALLNLFL